MLQLSATFDLQQDVVSSIFKKEATVGIIKEYSGIVDTRILNIERDGGVLYSWKGETGTTRIGKYDPNTRQNKLLYTFDKQVCVSSCSLNKEETLLAVSLAQRTRTEERLRPVSKCLTLLIEIHPINNTKVLKAVDCRVRVQFLHPDTERDSVLESHLLLVAEDGYVEQLHVMLVRQEGYRVVMLSPECLAKDRVAEDFSWVQWDSQTQRLFYLTHREKAVLKCVQFCHDRNCETLFELVLELPSNPFTCMRFVNLGFDHHQETQHEREEMRMVVITNNTGSMCVCYSQPACVNQEITYTIVLVHRGCSKTFSVALDGTPSPCSTDLLPLFIPIGYYVVVYLSGHFLHCINTRQQELLCHSLFLSGVDAELGVLGSDSVVLSLPESSLLDLNTGRMYTVDLNPSFLMDLLHCSHRRPDSQRLAALHCLLLYMGPNAALELKIIDWICDNVMPFDTFDQIQEFILASLYRIIYKKCLSLDEVLPYSSVFEKKKVPETLDQVPGVTCTTELHAEPVFKGKARSLQGYWEELQWSTEKMKYFEAVPNPRYRASQNLPDWTKLLTTLKSENTFFTLSVPEVREHVLYSVCFRSQRTRRLLTIYVTLRRTLNKFCRWWTAGILMVDKLREHLNRHLPRLGKKKIDVLVVNYVAKLLELIRRMLESVWLKYKLGPLVLCLKQRGSSAEWAVFHVMCRILEATKTLCLPLPPDLDNSDANEELKFSILKRLPESMEQRICHLWDHPISSACISRDYVRGLLEKHDKTKVTLSYSASTNQLYNHQFNITKSRK
ncbi:gamma-secretase-activating protein-like isoform X1 [Oncorhynchus keta]|uniref:gamma-secretase-activating protein-like isoform X1 n=1 Tax=Oncorhynchus keta TaxID=8018 RepID=UPI00227BA5E9|nr:gamma-secretase-activating protein-like isoform X1 [Oncorhynchus keta]